MTFSRPLLAPRTTAAFLAFFAGLSLAQAQAPQCSANAANVANLRLNGQAEAVGDVVVSCTGGTPTVTGQTVPGFNFTLTSTVPITSRLLSGTWSEALLLVDEPPPASQLACTAPNGNCTVQGTGNGQGTYSGAAGRPNIFQAQQLSQTSITYPGVPFDPPGAGGTRIFRFTNIRVNPSSLASQAQVSISVSITGGTTINVSPSQIAVGATVTPVTVTEKGVQMGANGLAQFVIEFTESNASTFKTRSTAVDQSTSPAPANQNTPNQFFPGVETHFFNSALPFVSGRGNLGAAGLADNGTRLLVSFPGIGQGISLTTSTTITTGGRLGAGSGVIRLISTDSSGVGSYQASPSGTLFPDQNGNITAVFEVLGDDPNNIEQFDIPFTINYSNGAAGLRSLAASAGLAPVSTIGGEDPSAPLPRFTTGLTTLQVSVLSISPTTAPQGSVGSPYSQLFTATGGTGPYTWSATGLPSGITMTTSGILSGTPVTPGTTQIVVTVTDSTGSSNSIQLLLSFVNGFVITTTTVPNGTVGQLYTAQISSAGGQGTVTYSIAPAVLTTPSALPPGIFLNPNGSLTGTPLTAGTYSFTVDAQDQMGHQTTQSFKQTIAPALVITTVSPLSTGQAGGGQLSFTIQATGGTPPYNFTATGKLPPGLTLTPSGLLVGNPTQAGTFMFMVTVTDAQGIAVTKQFQITLTPAPSLLQVSSSQLNFSALFGGDSPAPQTLVVTSSSLTPVNFTVALDSGTDGSAVPRWLSVQTTQGVTPAGVVVVVDQSSLVVGIADARILLTIPGDSTRLPVAIGVHLEIDAGMPQLDVSPSLLRLRARSAAPGVQSQVLLVRNTGGGGTLTFAAGVLGSASWITGVTGPTQTVFNHATPVTVTFNTQGLAPGTYRAILQFSYSPGTAVQVPIDLYVADTGPYLGVDTRGLRFQARQGAGSSYTQTVRILNLGDPGSIVNWTASLVAGSDWLALGTTRGTSTASQPGALVLSVTANAVNLAAGPHYALVQITDQLSIGSPQYFVAILDIAPSTAPPLPELSTGYLYFAASQGATSPVGGTVKVYTSSATPVNFQVATSTTDGGTWLQASPSSAAASTASPGQVTVVVNPTGLAAGIYKGQINIAMSGVLRTKDVTLVVTPNGSISQMGGAQVEAAAPRAGACVPSGLAMTLGNLTTSFDLPAQYPAMISVQLTDNCNSPVSSASVVAEFSNGDPPLTLSGDGTSNIYTESWQPGVVQQNMSVTIHANVAPYVEAVLTLTGNVEMNAAPVLSRGGTVNNSNPQLDAPLAPGTVVALFGANMSSGTNSPGVLPLLNSINGSYVLVGGDQLPLYYASPGQINAQLPVDLPLNRPQAVIVATGSAYTLPDNINITAVSPGVAAYPSGDVIAQHADFTLVNAASPAHPGEVLIMYLVGMGATNPSTPTGQQTTGPLEPAVVQPIVTVGSQQAVVSFAGLSPGGIGLYQINFQVPLGLPGGSANVTVTQGPAAANVTTLPISK